jgi:hypothetical protein
MHLFLYIISLLAMELKIVVMSVQLRDGPAWTVQEYMIRNNRWKEVVRAFVPSFENRFR